MTTTVLPEIRVERPHRPQRRKRRPWLALPLGGLVAAVLAGVVALGMVPRRGRRAELVAAAHEIRSLVETPRVKVVRAVRGAKPLSLRLPADLQPDQESPLHARAKGYLKRVLVDIGDRVEQGQLLAEIEAPEMDGELEKARATVYQASADLKLAVARGELAAINLRRAEALVQRNAAPVQDLDEARAAQQVADATVLSADATLAARKAEVHRLEDLNSFLRLVAPFAGTITARGFDPGALVTAEGSGQAPLFRIAQDDTLRVVVTVPQAHLAAIRLGQDVKILARELPGREFAGRVSRTARAVDPATRTLRTEIDLPNKDRSLYAGMFVEAEFARAGGHPLTVSANAVANGPEGTRVVVVDQAGLVHWRPIEIRRDLGARIEVSGGLEGDESIIENPPAGLADGARVEVVAPGEAKEPAPAKTAS